MGCLSSAADSSDNEPQREPPATSETLLAPHVLEPAPAPEAAEENASRSGRGVLMVESDVATPTTTPAATPSQPPDPRQAQSAHPPSPRGATTQSLVASTAAAGPAKAVAKALRTPALMPGVPLLPAPSPAVGGLGSAGSSASRTASAGAAAGRTACTPATGCGRPSAHSAHLQRGSQQVPRSANNAEVHHLQVTMRRQRDYSSGRPMARPLQGDCLQMVPRMAAQARSASFSTVLSGRQSWTRDLSPRTLAMVAPQCRH